MKSNVEFEAQLQNLGIFPGMDLVIRGNLAKFGRKIIRPQDFLADLRSYLGPSSTIVGLAFTKARFIHPLGSQPFTLASKSYTGSLFQLFQKELDCIRSSHPTNSFVAVGPRANLYLESHDERSEAFLPIRKAIELSARMLIFGCIRSSPGFTTTHVAEQDSRVSQKMIAPWLSCAYYYRNGNKHVFRRSDGSCCSQAYSKYYSFYLEKNAVRSGLLGSTSALSGQADTLYKIDIDAIRLNSSITICDSPLCSTCNLFRYDRLYKIPSFLYAKSLYIIENTLKRP
jgi:aminoglycoside N3'-acetyltransferase